MGILTAQIDQVSETITFDWVSLSSVVAGTKLLNNGKWPNIELARSVEGQVNSTS